MNTRSEETGKSLPAFRAVIKEVIARISLDEPVIGPTLDAVLHERFPIGKGGVGQAHQRIQAEIRQQIANFYAPRDWSAEPTYGREFA